MPSWRRARRRSCARSGCRTPRSSRSSAADDARAPGGGVTPDDFREAYPELFAYSDLRERLALYALVLRSSELSDDPARCVQVIEVARAWVRAFEPLLRQ